MQKTKKLLKSYILLGLSILLTSMGTLVFGINDQISYIQKSSFYKQTEATVIDYEYDIKTGKATEVIEYTVNENVYVKKLNKYTKNPKSINEKMKINYNPANPDEVIFTRNYTMYIIILLSFMTLSIAMIIIVNNYLKLKFYENKKKLQ